MNHLMSFLSIDRVSTTPVYEQIANSIITSIRQGRLRKGLKLPGSRELAAMLSLNRLTVVAAYQELEAQGWIQTAPRKGVFVKVELPVLRPESFDNSSVFHLPQLPLYRLDENKVVSPPLSEFPPPGRLIFNDGFPDVRLAPTEELLATMRSISRISSAKKVSYVRRSAGNASPSGCPHHIFV